MVDTGDGAVLDPLQKENPDADCDGIMKAYFENNSIFEYIIPLLKESQCFRQNSDQILQGIYH